jgi:hypothetical protein
MELIVRCSSLDDIMTNDRSGKKMGETSKKEFRKLYIREYYGREETIKSKYLDKGNERESDAITLLTRVNKRVYTKNSERLTNEFITGEYDVFSGDEILDTKCSWSLFSFLGANADDYKYQRVGYMWLTGAKKATVAYCLVNGTAKHIMDEKRRASYDYGLDPDVHPEYIKRCQQIERNHIFDMAEFQKENMGFDFHSDLSEWKWDIPKEQRVKQFTINRDESEIELLKARIIEGRKWLETEFNTTLNPPHP